jgi:hypothetical protein
MSSDIANLLLVIVLSAAHRTAAVEAMVRAAAASPQRRNHVETWSGRARGVHGTFSGPGAKPFRCRDVYENAIRQLGFRDPIRTDPGRVRLPAHAETAAPHSR